MELRAEFWFLSRTRTAVPEIGILFAMTRRTSALFAKVSFIST